MIRPVRPKIALALFLMVVVFLFGIFGYKTLSDFTRIGYVDSNEKHIINPEADMTLQPKIKLIVLGVAEQLRKLNQMFQIG